MLSAALLVATALSGPPDRAPARSAPTRYRIEQSVETVVDLSAFGQGDQVTTNTMVWYLSATSGDSAGGRVLQVVLDSVQAEFVAVASRDSLRGARYRVVLDPSGKVVSLTGGAPGAVGSLFEGQLRGLYPRVKAGATAGATWADTLETTSDTPQARTTTNTLTSFTLGAPEPYQGTTARRVRTTSSYLLKGSVMTPGGPADMEGKGTGAAVYFVAADGLVLGSTTTTNGDAMVSMASAPAPIPVKTSTNVTVTVLK